MRNEGGQGGMAMHGGMMAGTGGMAGQGAMLRRDSIVKLIRHELNTPLATALLYLGIAEGSAAALPGGVVHSALRVARAEVQRLKTLLDTVTELECVGYATPRPRSINVGETVRATVERLVAVRDAATVRVVTLGDLHGWWDRSMVEQIVGNLLSNALKFGLGRPIRIDVKPAEYGVHISVRDHGIGVAATDQEWIFERNRHSTPEEGGGLGLGLWLVRELASAHGGWVTLESRKGRGSTFTVFLRTQRSLTHTATHTATHTGTRPGLAEGARLRRTNWQAREARSPKKTPLLARRATDDPLASTMTSPSLTAGLNASVPSKTRRPIQVLSL
ncbi:MAG TPA: HAMP domain-containing sensor histidine kinase [Polyangia bacterium]|nr:HAMP domain-containing sensor histidine kinase [Polyangia bacterium]